MKNKRKVLIGSVVAIHLFFFFFNFKRNTPPPPPKKSIVVHTYAPPPPPKVVKQTAPSKKTTPPPRKAPSPTQSILKELKESLEKIEATPPPPSTMQLPKKISSLQIDHADKKEETDYFMTLAHALKEGLELPDQGEVKLELTVSQSGQVLKLRVLHALSDKNRRYLELNLPQMHLPPFSEELKNENSHTFTLTFCNAS